MTPHTAVCINNYLPACKAGVSFGSADDEFTRCVYMQPCIIIKVFPANRNDDLLFDLFFQQFLGHVLKMLLRYNDGIKPMGLPVFIFHCYL